MNTTSLFLYSSQSKSHPVYMDFYSTGAVVLLNNFKHIKPLDTSVLVARAFSIVGVSIAWEFWDPGF